MTPALNLTLITISAFACIGWIIGAAVFWYASRRAVSLMTVSPDGPEPLPKLTIIVPALNEEHTIEPAMRSLLAMDYPDYEVIAVDDRSTDRTGEILDLLAKEDGRLKVLHIKELPHGWLGKNHALHAGSLQASGDWILFTDADVHFAPDALRRALRYALANNLDHLVAFPEMDTRDFWERLYVSYFGSMFTIWSRPWAASNPRSKAYIGVGAFNLVRTGLYRSFGGHSVLPMDVADDVKLGKMMKRNGGRQECITAEGLIKVRWVEGLRGAILGGEKNMYAGIDYKPLLAIRTALALFAGVIWPPIGLFVGPLPSRLLCAGALLGMMACVRASGFLRLNALYGLAYPLGAALFLYAMLRSMVLAHRRGGIIWRGTLYPLQKLRRGIV